MSVIQIGPQVSLFSYWVFISYQRLLHLIMLSSVASLEGRVVTFAWPTLVLPRYLCHLITGCPCSPHLWSSEPLPCLRLSLPNDFTRSRDVELFTTRGSDFHWQPRGEISVRYRRDQCTNDGDGNEDRRWLVLLCILITAFACTVSTYSLLSPLKHFIARAVVLSLLSFPSIHSLFLIPPFSLLFSHIFPFFPSPSE